MKTNYLVSINNINDIDVYKKAGLSTFLFALEDYCVGYNGFSVNDINSSDINKYVLINRLLNSDEIDSLRSIIGSIDCIGFIIEDIGLINVIKSSCKDKKIILFMNHFNCNYVSCNEWLDIVDSVVISNELTYEEIKDICSKTKKRVVLNTFGHNQVMYSRRLLLKNYYDTFLLPYKNCTLIKDKMGSVSFILWESDYGTVVYSSKVFDGRRLLGLDNVLFNYVNSSLMDCNDVIKLIKGEDIDNCDSGFLDRKTVYKLGDY